MSDGGRRRAGSAALACAGLCAVLESPSSWISTRSGGPPGPPARVGSLPGPGLARSAPAPARGRAWAAALGAGVAAGAWAAALAGRLAAGKRRRGALAVLPDGTNDEGEDLQEPLTVKLPDVSGVVLYGNEFSPPCQKIQTMLKFYKVPFQMVAGRHPSSDYKKIPVLEMNGRQINDSHIIVKNLAPVLTGEPFTQQQSDWEKRITFEFQPSIEVELFGNGSDLARAAGVDGWKEALAKLVAPLLGPLVGSIFRSRYGDFPPSATFGKQFREACGGEPFFHGASPGPVDLSLYGTYAGMAQKGCEIVDTFLDGSGLRPWHDRMEEATKASPAASA